LRVGLSVLLFIFFMALLFSSLASMSSALEAGVDDASSLVSSLISNPSGLASFLIQLALGAGLGYYSAKIIKQILALIAIFFIGILLNIWMLEGLKDEIIKYGLKILPLIQTLIATLGITIVLPVSLGFFIGIALAARK
jgi:hypothetical protein